MGARKERPHFNWFKRKNQLTTNNSCLYFMPRYYPRSNSGGARSNFQDLSSKASEQPSLPPAHTCAWWFLPGRSGAHSLKLRPKIIPLFPSNATGSHPKAQRCSYTQTGIYKHITARHWTTRYSTQPKQRENMTPKQREKSNCNAQKNDIFELVGKNKNFQLKLTIFQLSKG